MLTLEKSTDKNNYMMDFSKKPVNPKITNYPCTPLHESANCKVI